MAACRDDMVMLIQPKWPDTSFRKKPSQRVANLYHDDTPRVEQMHMDMRCGISNTNDMLGVVKMALKERQKMLAEVDKMASTAPMFADCVQDYGKTDNFVADQGKASFPRALVLVFVLWDAPRIVGMMQDGRPCRCGRS